TITALDIDTVRKALDEVRQARDSADRAELANRMKDEFLAMLAHELRNPLTPIRNSVESLRRRIAQLPDCTAILDRMDRQVRHMTLLLNDLLDVSRITQRKIRLNKEPVDVAAAIN